MPTSRQAALNDPSRLIRRLGEAYKELDNDQVIELVKDHLLESGPAAFEEATGSDKDIPLTAPCIIFLVFGSFNYPTMQRDGTVQWIRVSKAGYGYKAVIECLITLRRDSAVVIVHTGHAA
ncbi:hypothetical protein QQS21_012361 [Conoideocrella luteorostrata]|uniref:Uncharacterized protein n=1 Tax=Conoideocrella luteorostrata TaxID=1105319 RepID=A0AAJ0CE20_9HYPO|nr:hypothetical protein QQS21_012361 [Conoideocrella luteorostrata]